MRTLAALVTSLTLPYGGIQWWTAASVGHSVLVTGSPPTGALCEYDVVDPGTLDQRGPIKRPCNDPPVSNGRIMPAVGSEAVLSRVPLSVAGKVVMRFGDYSDTRPQYASYGRSLWVYDVATTDGAEALLFDSHSGKLLQRTAMPKVYRPVMVANADGLWLDPATNGGISGVSVVPVLHVALGAAKPVVVHRGGRAALWMAATSHTVWFEQIAGRSRLSIWRIDGTTSVRLLSRPTQPGMQAVYGAGRLWEITCGRTKDRLLRIDPGTGTPTPAGQFANTSLWTTSMTVSRGKLFVLVGQKLYVYR